MNFCLNSKNLVCSLGEDSLLEIDSFVYNNVSKEFSSNAEECGQDCQSYKKCEAFIYYSDFKCYLFYLNNNINALNERLAANINKNALIGFKSKVLMKKLYNVSLGNMFYFKFTCQTESECIKKCLLYNECSGVSLDTNNCYLYKQLEMTEKFNSISYIKSESADHRFQKTENQNKQNIMKLNGIQLLDHFDSMYSISAEQCWHLCENKANCLGSSFASNYFKPNQKYDGLYNCFFYNSSFRAIVNPSQISFISINGK